MKKTLIFTMALIALISCKKEDIGCYEPDNKKIEAKIDFECSGTYLITKDAVLKVCSADDFSGFTENEVVYVTYTEVSDCPYYDSLLLCHSYVPHDAIVSLSSITAKSPKATLERDCTGTYIDVNGLDYRVCNSDKLKDVEAGALLEVDFKELEECTNPDNEYICMMAREFHGVAKVRSFTFID